MQTNLHDRFTQTFTEEHREIRDALMDLAQVFSQRDMVRARTLLARVAELTGPHFRYEEESLYPALVAIFGDEYVEKLLEDHDRAIGAAQRLVALAQKETLDEEEVALSRKLVLGLLPHVSDCNGLTIMVERLPEAKVQAIFQTRARAQEAGLDLLQWTEQVRPRPASQPTGGIL